ncbi:MAG: hypothetical protein AB1Z18_05465 [Desulfobacterales bacterium]|jgi:hypothetical protein
MAGEVTLEWDLNIEPDIAGYIVYWGTTSRNYSDSVDVGNQNSYADIDHDGDFDSDGNVDGGDFTLIVKSYGKSGCP